MHAHGKAANTEALEPPFAGCVTLGKLLFSEDLGGCVWEVELGSDCCEGTKVRAFYLLGNKEIVEVWKQERTS